MRVALLLRQPVLGDVDLAAEQRLDAVLAGLLVELDRAREAPVVGERDGRHLQLGGAGGELRNPAGPVEDRILGVDVEVNELGHARRARLPSRSDGSCPPRCGAAGARSGASQRNQAMLAARVAAPSPMTLKTTLYGDDRGHREQRRKPQRAPLRKPPEGEREHQRDEEEERRGDPRLDPVAVGLPRGVLAAGVHAAAVEPEEALEEPRDAQTGQPEDAEPREPPGAERAPQAEREAEDEQTVQVRRDLVVEPRADRPSARRCR